MTKTVQDRALSLRIGVMGIRTIIPSDGWAGADKIALELSRRFRARGHEVTAYCRRYLGQNEDGERLYSGVNLIYLPTVSRDGFDTLVHSLLVSLHIIAFRTCDVVLIHNGGNAVFACLLRLFGKKVVLMQDGIDWKRARWSWFVRTFLWASTRLTAFQCVVFDNAKAKRWFEVRFQRKYHLIHYGCEVPPPHDEEQCLSQFGLNPKGYFLYVGRLVPEKGVHYLVEAFVNMQTDLPLLIVGGAPFESPYASLLYLKAGSRIRFPGWVYGNSVHVLIKNAYAYVNASDVEGLSPGLLIALGLGTPVICSDIEENILAVGENALTFRRSDTASLRRCIDYAIERPGEIAELAMRAQSIARERFSWDVAADRYIRIFKEMV